MHTPVIKVDQSMASMSGHWQQSALPRSSLFIAVPPPLSFSSAYSPRWSARWGVDGFRSRGTVRRGRKSGRRRAWRCRPPAKTARTLICNAYSSSPPPASSPGWPGRGPGGPGDPSPTPSAAQGVEIPDFATRAWIVVDGSSGDVLAGQNIDEQRPMASTIKTLTALTLLPRLQYDSTYEALPAETLTEGLTSEFSQVAVTPSRNCSTACSCAAETMRRSHWPMRTGTSARWRR